jgi:hypothetical protein
MRKQDSLNFPTSSRLGFRGGIIKKQNLLDRRVSIGAPIGSGKKTSGEGSR